MAETQSGPVPVEVWTLIDTTWRRIDRPTL
jgi:hypothetical protein